MNTKVPPEITPEIIKFCGRFATKEPSVYVQHQPEPSEPLHECFNVVARKIAKDGGSIQHGWSIGEWPTIMLDAEFHAIWLSPSGQLVNVTPLEFETDRILFIADPRRRFEGVRVPNRRMPLRKHEAVKAFISVCQYLEAYEGPEPGLERLVGQDAQNYADALAAREQLIKFLASITPKER